MDPETSFVLIMNLNINLIRSVAIEKETSKGTFYGTFTGLFTTYR